ncbi:myristylated tegument protein [Bovine herpesvirus type 1.2 strain SM023]|uniref:Cytoplasmic envelopment protein 3 n=4 Tax=Bovine herpesvirus type 1.2 TaxID=79890 RepID=A0A089N479_BHV1|nr:myristylated tegument protein [Bovine herpesvirus type 1.2 strain K22]AIQ80700.1 myristylated tegument protein [Bovine herpesvirus type 1.2 strain B589]AIQ80770.1 myristylated tegument protein [Bovine herpesvirus type 1.2 strain SM023]AIQ80840.1 myristylated tegument protein [Bovine herpesvirus type 1.2 strain SP1777]QVY10581.1 UL11 tegument myristylated protein [Bovine alphaherpesvirus 5]UWL63389.1 myristylated tegument protein [Bovine herpesvirus type 1.2]
MGQAASCSRCRRNRILTRAGDLVALDAAAFEDFSLDDLQALTAGAAAGEEGGEDKGDADDDWSNVITSAPRRGQRPPVKPYRPQRREVY